MKLPRNLSGKDLMRRLKVLGYEPTRQTGSHIRLTTQQGGEHHITVPNHDPLKVGTLSSILDLITEYFQINRNELLQQLFK